SAPLDHRHHGRVVGGVADEHETHVLQRAGRDGLEGGLDQAGHARGRRRTEGQQVALLHAALHRGGGGLDLALVLGLELRIRLRRQVVQERVVGDVAHVLLHHRRQVRLPGGVVVLGRGGQLPDLGGLVGHRLFLATAGQQQRGRRQAGEQERAHRLVHQQTLPFVRKNHLEPCSCRAAFRAAATAGVTNPDTSPPRRAISRTSDEKMKLYCSAGVRNRVSTSGIRWRFMLAIWNSYSKSDTARRPRSSTPAPTSRTKCASSVSNPRTSTFGCPESASRASLTRSSSGSVGPLAWLAATPTITFSNSGAARSTRSMWPLVIGSKVPG